MMQFSREWDRDVDGSPNRLDAAIWALTPLSWRRFLPRAMRSVSRRCNTKRSRFSVPFPHGQNLLASQRLHRRLAAALSTPNILGFGPESETRTR
jgi:hypothetical protein